MRPPTVRLTDNEDAGYWKVSIGPAGATATDVTMVRGVPTLIQSMSTTDPFGPAQAELSFPGISMLDRFGAGTDLAWLRPEANVNIAWVDAAEGAKPGPVWEGFVSSFSWPFDEASGTLTVGCTGALRQADYCLAKPRYRYRPIPFEKAIQIAMDGVPDRRYNQTTVVWPSWWKKTYNEASYKKLERHRRPEGIGNGKKWSGMLTRETGQWDQILSSFVQGLLTAMQTDNGQFTLMLDAGRKPVIRFRSRLLDHDLVPLVLDVLTPGINLDLSLDFTQRLNVVYGQGRSLAGTTYSNMRVSPSGMTTYYDPFAANKHIHPDKWAWVQSLRHEVRLQFYEGMSAQDGEKVARAHLTRHSEPGIMGTITLQNADFRNPRTNRLVSRQRVTAGQTLRLDGFMGQNPGPLLHITEAMVSPQDNTCTIKVDSKYRDQLTAQEIRLRGRDALTPTRLMTVGQYQPNIPDQLLPWSYPQGSGFIPYESLKFWKGAPENLAFPWDEWTRRRPPKSKSWRGCYIRIGPASTTNAGKNWNRGPGAKGSGSIAHLRLSQAGDIKLLQIAAFDRNGNVMKVGFHVSIWQGSTGVTASDTPKLLADDMVPGKDYKKAQPYPFYRNAWEQFDAKGNRFSDPNQTHAEQILLMGYGNFFERAGYYPGSSSVYQATPTGLLVDETGFSYDGSTNPNFDPTGKRKNSWATGGVMEVLIYCDEQGDESVYFLGRCYRREPGTS